MTRHLSRIRVCRDTGLYSPTDMRNLLACTAVVAALGVTGCPDIKQDPGEGSGDLGATAGPTVEFDPANKIVPFPNNLLLDPATGKVNLPMQCNESPVQTQLRTLVLNKLDGFGTFEVALQATFTETPDTASVTAADVVLYKRADAGTPVDGATAMPVPTRILLGKFPRLAADCVTATMVDTLTVVPLVPLDQHSTYTVALLSGINNGSGAAFIPSFTWALVRQSVEPVTLDASGNVTANSTPLDPTDPAQLAQLQGIDLLWKAHAGALAFLDGALKSTDRSKVLLAWDFNTQTTTDVLDAHIATSPAGKVPTTPFVALPSALTQLCGGNPCTAQQFLEGSPIGPLCTDHPQNGGYIPCDKVGDILGGLMTEDIYQSDSPNAFDATKPIPGPWSDPIAPVVIHANAPLQVIAMIPKGAAPAGGWPVVIYGHGLGSKKETLIAIGPQLAALGFASVGIDFVAHGSRAVQVTNAAAVGCDGTPDASVSPQCFAPFLSANLATTRDNIRQSIVDLHRVHAALLACGVTPTPAGCGQLAVDPTHIEYIGISLAGIMGSTFTATADLKAAVLNVPGVGWLDILENTANPQISCSLVDALIGAGILTGTPSNLANASNPALCATNAWQQQPGYVQFASVARWILDSADGANYTPKLAHQRFFIQEVVGDQVVPNVATDDEGTLVGLTPATADPFTSASSPASAALVAMITASNWLRYPTLPADAATGFPGNAFQHASLLAPVGPNLAGILGTARVETDALTFLFANK